MSRTVLIVDDQKLNRQILCRMLVPEYIIIEAENGADALELITGEHNDISAVLLDIVMPVMDGYELLIKLRENPELAHIPVIVTTGNTEPDAEKKALALGANDYVQKPYDPDILKHRLQNIITLRESAAIINSYQMDRLTGLMSRESFFEHAAKAISEKPDNYYVLSCIDVDNFKVINDRYGAETGDEVLKYIAGELRRDCDAAGGICGRISADNFVILLAADIPGNRHSDEYFQEIASLSEFTFPVTLSVGRFYVSDRTLPVSAMYDRAKIARETIKGRSDIHAAVFDESMRSRIIREQEIVNEMHGALRDGQFEAWFQPQYNHVTGAMIGSEALVRWRHPVRGLVSPGEFIPVFERNGFIYELDKYIWKEVCRRLRGWLDEGLSPLPVSVNISRFDILRADLTEYITGLVEKYALPIELLRLEITESAFASETDKIISVVAELVRLGFLIEIDDFGSGYSSLNTLKDVPAQILKLDMKFLQDSASSERAGNIVESVVRMAKWLGMSVIAEGVEKREQADYLRSIGCNYIQGYLYARPMPSADYERHWRQSGAGERLIEMETVENLNNNLFWDPRSLDSLIFNSYVGAACIFEYFNGKIEVIRATKAYIDLFGGELTAAELMKLDLAEYLDAESVKLAAVILAKSAAGERQLTEEFVFRSFPGVPYDIHFRCTMSVIAATGNRMLVYCLNENVTEQRRAEREIIENDEHIHFLNELSHELLASPDTEIGIISVLRRLLEYFRGSRAYILELGQDGGAASVTYEIHPDGRLSGAESLQHLSYTLLKPWFDRCGKHGYIAITGNDISRTDGSEERKILGVRGSSSLFAAPLYRDGRLIGLFGVDDPQLHTEQAERFVILGDYIAVMLTRRDMNARITMDAQALHDMMNDTPGGFMRIRVTTDGTAETVFVNRPYCRMRGMTYSEAVCGRSDEAVSAFHPDDREAVSAAIVAALETGETWYLQCRLLQQDGGSLPVNAFGRVSADGAETYINIYLTDMSAQERRNFDLRDTMARTLSAIMTSSNDIAYAKDRELRFICCSPAVIALADAESEADVIGKTDYELFPADTADQFRKNELAVLESNVPSVDQDEVITTRRGERLRCSASRYILRDASGEVIGLYGIARDMTAERDAQDRLELLNNSLPGGIATYRISTDDIRITYYNDGFCRLAGCTRAEYEAMAENSGVLGLVFDEDKPILTGQLNTLLADGTPMDCTYRSHKINGDGYVWINLRGVLTERSDSDATVNVILYDVTEQQEAKLQAVRAEQLERQLAQRISVVLKNAGAGIRATTSNGDNIEYLFVNDKFFEILGYTRESYEATVADRYSVIHPDDLELTRAAMLRLNSVGDADTLEFRIITPAGEVRWLRVNITVSELEGVESPVQLYVHMDITGEKEKSEQDKLLLENLPAGAGIYELKNGEMSLVFQNKSFWRLVGLSEEAYPDSRALSAIYPDDVPRVMQELGAAISERRDVQCDILLRHLTEGYIPVHLAGRIVPHGTDALTIFATFTPNNPDLMSYREMMPRLLSTVMSGTEDYAFAKDRELRYTTCSAAFLRLAGLQNESEAIGRTDYDLFPFEKADQIRKWDTELFRGESAVMEYDETVHTGDGTERYIHTVKYALRDANGHNIGIYGISRDISDIKAMESQLEMVSDNLPGGIVTYTFDNEQKLRIVYCNDGFCELFGGTREGLAARGDFDPIDWICEPEKEDLILQNTAMLKESNSGDCLFRIRMLDGGMRWVKYKATAARRYGNSVTVNAILLDVTQTQIMLEQLRISEQEHILAVQHGGNTVCRYEVLSKTLTPVPSDGAEAVLSETLENVPEGPIGLGLISVNSAPAYRTFFENIIRGEKTGTALFEQCHSGVWRWIEAKSTTIFSDGGEPVRAVVSMFDVTERRERELAYNKFQQSLSDKEPGSYTIFRINLNRGESYETKDGGLLVFNFDTARGSFDDRARAYAGVCVYPDDRERYLALVNSDSLLAGYYRGKRAVSADYRELIPTGGVRWLRVTAELVESAGSTDIEVYLLYENIDSAKRAELHTKQLAETDPLTGILNRTTFAEQVDQRIRSGIPGTNFAFLMLDIDGFKRVNDVLGHGEGDRTLIELAEGLRSIVRSNDLVARLGGDEFVVFLSGIHNERTAVEKAKQICTISRKSFGTAVQMSGSVGISMAPGDGVDFTTLYRKADEALYYVKASGKDGVAVYGDIEAYGESAAAFEYDAVRDRRILIVDDSRIDHMIMRNIFDRLFDVEEAEGGASALAALNRPGSEFSAVLLDLNMPDMDGFAVLERIRSSETLRSIPVIIVSGDESRETCIKAIRKGATDFVTKPIDSEVLLARVRSAVIKAENERLREKRRAAAIHNGDNS